jgi:hypothetical protein
MRKHRSQLLLFGKRSPTSFCLLQREIGFPHASLGEARPPHGALLFGRWWLSIKPGERFGWIDGRLGCTQRHQNPGGPSPTILLAGPQYVAFATLALGMAVSLPFGPQGITGVLGASSRKAIQRNAALLPAYSIMLGLMALLGYMALAARIKPNPYYKRTSPCPRSSCGCSQAGLRASRLRRS